MKLFVIALVLVGVCTAKSFCKPKSEAKSDAETIVTAVVLNIPLIFGHCNAAKKNADSFFGNKCKNVVRQGYCYGKSLYDGYEVADKVADCSFGEGERDYSVSVTYTDVAAVLSSNGPVQQLGALACESALPCAQHLAKKLAKCAADDDTFYAVALENARTLLEPLITGNMDAFEDSLVCHFGADSDALTLLDLIKQRITSFDDIVALVNKYVSADTQDSLVSGARSGLYSFLEGSSEFCAAGCISKTSAYFMNLFTATHDAETCPTIESYCGGCQNNAESFISANADSVPCCTQTAMDSIVGSLQYMIEEYGDLISKIESAVTDTVTEADVSVAGYEAVKAAAMEQAGCFEDTYDDLADGDCA